ncbi:MULTISPECIES: SPOR domain-containing protein [Stutzerimonas]|uniref:SPOR domain-containing protein n=1 Tax=Stutzerimonas TaxID=2901164 RepID=UPI00350F9D2F
MRPVAPTSAPATTEAASAPVRTGWVVQVARVSNRNTAEALQERLRAEGYDAFIGDAGAMTLVYAGPLADRDEANRLRDRLSAEQRLDGIVVRIGDD